MEASAQTGADHSVDEDEVFALEVSDATLMPKRGLEVRTVTNTEDESGEMHREQSETPLCRKVIPTLEEEPNVCSICLDEFTIPDPSTATTCGHGYHLQCIMQWAQRSRECPLCFHTLQLEDEAMNALLPFGEYVSPREQAASAAMLESWEFERFLLRLAAAEQRERRSSRQVRLRRTSSRGQPSSPQSILGRSTPETSGGQAEAGQVSASVPGREESGGGFPSPLGGNVASSWPPGRSDGANGGPSASGEHVGIGEMLSPTIRSASQAIKTRFASLNLRNSLNKTTKELKSLFGSASTSRADDGER